MFITYLNESEHNERSQFIKENFQRTMKKSASLKPLNEFENKKTLYAKSLIKNLYENIVYKEDFEVEESDSLSSKFANIIITGKVANEVFQHSMKTMPTTVTDERVLEMASTVADQLTKDWFEDSKLELIAVEEAIANNEKREQKISESALASKFEVFKEFKILSEIKNEENGDVANALISEMTDLDKSKLAIKIATFKKCLEAVGIDTKAERMSKLIKEEFNKTFYN